MYVNKIHQKLQAEAAEHQLIILNWVEPTTDSQYSMDSMFSGTAYFENAIFPGTFQKILHFK